MRSVVSLEPSGVGALTLPCGSMLYGARSFERGCCPGLEPPHPQDPFAEVMLQTLRAVVGDEQRSEQRAGHAGGAVIPWAQSTEVIIPRFQRMSIDAVQETRSGLSLSSTLGPIWTPSKPSG